MIYCLDLIGVFAFAFLGARVARSRGSNWLGTIVCAFVTAVGGGTIRELLLGHRPFYFDDLAYALVIAIAVGAALWSWRYFHVFKPYIAVFNAIGVATFALLGAQAAAHAGLGPLGMTCFAVLTAYGGGAIADLLTGHQPRLFRDNVIALPPIALALWYWLLRQPTDYSLLALLLAGICGCHLAITHLPRPRATRMRQLLGW